MDSKSPPVLMKALENWTEDELDGLFKEDGSGWALVGNSYDDVRGIREWLTTNQNYSAAPTRDQLITCINWAEELRLLMGIIVTRTSKNLEWMRAVAADAGCAFCEWKYRDAEFEMPDTQEVTAADVDPVRGRVNDAIIAHVKVCPNHPTRVIEKAVDQVCNLIRACDERFEATEFPKLGMRAPISMDEWRKIRQTLENVHIPVSS